MALAGGYSAKGIAIAIGSISFSGRAFTYTEGNQITEVTSEDSSGKEEFVLGLEKAITGTADGFCKTAGHPTKPTTAVLATLDDGYATKSVTVGVSDFTVSAAIDGSCAVSFNFTEVTG